MKFKNKNQSAYLVKQLQVFKIGLGLEDERKRWDSNVSSLSKKQEKKRRGRNKMWSSYDVTHIKTGYKRPQPAVPNTIKSTIQSKI